MGMWHEVVAKSVALVVISGLLLMFSLLLARSGNNHTQTVVFTWGIVVSFALVLCAGTNLVVFSASESRKDPVWRQKRQSVRFEDALD